MAKQRKKYRGHFCKVCCCVLPNEKFSGKGHKKHICKACSRLSKNEQSDLFHTNDINDFVNFKIHPDISKKKRARKQSRKKKAVLSTATKKQSCFIDKKNNNIENEFIDHIYEDFFLMFPETKFEYYEATNFLEQEEYLLF